MIIILSTVHHILIVRDCHIVMCHNHKIIDLIEALISIHPQPASQATRLLQEGFNHFPFSCMCALKHSKVSQALLGEA